MPDTPTTPAETLAAKLARLEALRSENEADWRPSFVALLERCEAPAVTEYREAA